jgi:hypothetical protein
MKKPHHIADAAVADEVFMSPALATTVLPFLNGVTRVPKWTNP